MISTKQHPRALRLSILVILLIPFIIGTAHSQISKKEFATEYLLNKYRNEPVSYTHLTLPTIYSV